MVLSAGNQSKVVINLIDIAIFTLIYLAIELRKKSTEVELNPSSVVENLNLAKFLAFLS